jgi:hypothetical protein
MKSIASKWLEQVWPRANVVKYQLARGGVSEFEWPFEMCSACANWYLFSYVDSISELFTGWVLRPLIGHCHYSTSQTSVGFTSTTPSKNWIQPKWPARLMILIIQRNRSSKHVAVISFDCWIRHAVRNNIAHGERHHKKHKKHKGTCCSLCCSCSLVVTTLN